MNSLPTGMAASPAAASIGSPLAEMFSYQPGYAFQRQDVLFLDNRPPDQGADKFDEEITDMRKRLERPQADQVLTDLPTEFISDDNVKSMIEEGLREGRFKGSTRIREKLGEINGQVDFARMGMLPFRLAVANADLHIQELLSIIRDGRVHPAGVILGGSPKMVNETHQKDPAVMGTIELCHYLLQENIPMLGICFGMQLLCFVKYDAMPEWLENPVGMTVRQVSRRKADKPVTDFLPIEPGKRHMVFGSWLVRRNVSLQKWNGQSNGEHHNPMMRRAAEIRALELHNQGLPFPHPKIPDDKVLARSTRTYRPHPRSSRRDSSVQSMTEVVEFGPYAVGVQSHPELMRELLIALTYIPKYKKFLQSEGQDVELLREYLHAYDSTGSKGHKYSAGERYLYNWIKYLLVPHNLSRILKEEPLGESELCYLNYVMAKLVATNPNLVDHVGDILGLKPTEGMTRTQFIYEIFAKLFGVEAVDVVDLGHSLKDTHEEEIRKNGFCRTIVNELYGKG